MGEKVTIFFSWSNEHQNTKKYILKLLDYLKEDIKDNGITLNIVESTSNALGFAKIEEVILDSIDQCDFFVADLTPTKGKGTVNSNVCFELGYMAGHHGTERIFGICNKKYVKNPSTELPFDFSHNRVLLINAESVAEEVSNMQKYADIIKNSIIEFKEHGNLCSRQPLHAHDRQISEIICKSLNHLKEMVFGFTERLEVYSGADPKNTCPGDYDFLDELVAYMKKCENQYSNTSLEKLRQSLLKALCDFLAYQSCHTFDFFPDKFRRCTKLYLIEEHPGLCLEYGLPCIFPTDDKYEEIIKPFKEESNEYRAKAEKVIECYMKLEERFVYLSD